MSIQNWAYHSSSSMAGYWQDSGNDVRKCFWNKFTMQCFYITGYVKYQMCVIDSQYIRTHLELNSNHAPFHLPFLINCYANGFNSFIRVQRSAYVFVKIRHQNLYLVWVWAFKCKFWQLYNFSSHWITEYFSLNNSCSALVLIIRCIWISHYPTSPLLTLWTMSNFWEISLVDTCEKTSEPQMVLLIQSY